MQTQFSCKLQVLLNNVVISERKEVNVIIFQNGEKATCSIVLKLKADIKNSDELILKPYEDVNFVSLNPLDWLLISPINKIKVDGDFIIVEGVLSFC